MNKINMLHRDIESILTGFYHLCENVIRVVRGHPALLDGLANPSDDVFGLVNSLHTSIINYEVVHKTFRHGAYVQPYNEDEMGEDDEDNAIYFIDRQYWSVRPSMRGRGRPYDRQRGEFPRGRTRSTFPY